MDDFDVLVGKANLMSVSTSLKFRQRTIRKTSPARIDLISDLQEMIDNLGQTIVTYELMYRIMREQMHEIQAIRIVNEQQRLEINELSTKVKNMEDYYGNI